MAHTEAQSHRRKSRKKFSVARSSLCVLCEAFL